MNSKAHSPSSTGPDGAYFEVRVGAFYNLAMLAEAEPRGLPGTKIERVALQRAAEGYPLDDVIIHAKTNDGKAATLEIQVKRSITFSPSDEVFLKVVKQIAQASAKPQFCTEQYELAVATAQTSRKIEGAYQDVLRWARELGDATTFFERLARPGSASEDMRTFVETFKTNLKIAQLPPDDETVWRLLRRFQILVFDFNSTGSISEQLSIERATKILLFEERHQARSLWNILIQISLQIAASGGDRNRAALMEEASLQSFHFSGHQSYAFACDVLAEASDNALKDINDKISDITLARYERLTAIREALDQGRYIEIRGDSGTGKSGLLKHCAMQIMMEARTIVLSPYRTTKGGWTAMRTALKFEGTAQDLLKELALNGSAIIFIDNLDLFSEEERVTVIDLIRAASEVRGVSIIATARSTFGIDEPSWLPSDALAHLGRVPPILIKDLNKTEIEEIQHALPALASLLTIGHPAYEVSRTLFRLSYLSRKTKEEQMVFSETEMASAWWETVDDIPRENRRESKRLLVDLLKHSLNGYDPIDTSKHTPHIVDQLVRKGILRDLGNERADFSHDVFREWGIANLLHQNPSVKDLLNINCPGRADILRGLELASRMSLEISGDFSKWKQLLDYFSQKNAHHKWRRSILLGLAHSEIACKLLQDHKVSNFLLADDARILGEIVGTLMATETIPASDILVNQGVPKKLIPLGLHIPIGPSWKRVITWLLTVDQKLPEEANLQVIKLYIAWCEGRFGKGSNIPSVLKSLYRWLNEIETTRRFENSDDCIKPFGHTLDHHLQKELESDLRRVFLAFCDQVPQLAIEYLQILGKRRKSDDAIINVLTFHGVLAQIAPKELADLTAKILIRERNEEDIHRIDPFDGPFDHSFDCIFSPASPAQGPFLELLTYAPHNGLSLVRQLCEHAASFFQETSCDATIVVDFPDESKKFLWKASYGWSRGSSFAILASAFMALEAWSHKRIEAGEDIEKVLADLLGPADSPAAYLLVAVDILISHWPKTQELAIPFTACPELLALDIWRLAHDRTSPYFSNFFLLSKEPAGATNLSSLQNRPSRRASLLDLIGLYAINELHAETLRNHLKKAIERVGHPEESSKIGDPRLMAYRALNRANPANWIEVQRKNSDSTDVEYQYVPPIDETQWLSKLKANQKNRCKTNTQKTGILHKRF